MTNPETFKQQAAEAAVALIRSGMIVGLGTGSTAVYAVRRIGALLAEGRLTAIRGIPTAEVTAREAERCGVPLTTLNEHPVVDIAIDGADEIDPGLNLIKGLGGALLREKIVAAAARRFVVIADDSKLVSRLGSRAPVPVEVILFAHRPVADYLASLGAAVTERRRDGELFITDEGNLILDCTFSRLSDPVALADRISRRPGVVEHGLFLGMATEAIVAGANGVVVMKRPAGATGEVETQSE